MFSMVTPVYAFPLHLFWDTKSLIEHCSGTPSTGSKSELFARERIMLSSWWAIPYHLQCRLKG